MFSITRDKDGKISGIFAPNLSNMEQIEGNHPELIEFLQHGGAQSDWNFLQSDLELIRVLEDLIEVLISKNIITITDFPQPVIDKLLARKAVRKKLTGAIAMEFDDESSSEL